MLNNWMLFTRGAMVPADTAVTAKDNKHSTGIKRRTHNLFVKVSSLGLLDI
jgi:hypothetical protein